MINPDYVQLFSHACQRMLNRERMLKVGLALAGLYQEICQAACTPESGTAQVPQSLGSTMPSKVSLNYYSNEDLKAHLHT